MASKLNFLTGGFILLMCVLGSSCTKYDYIDGGLANGIHDCSMWDYLHTNSYDWDSTVIMIEHAGLKSLFDGTGEYKEITFFGLTNHSIRAYMLDRNKGLEESDPDYVHRVTDLPVDKCVDILYKLVVPKRVMLKDIPRGRRVSILSKYTETDGTELSAIRGKLFLWTIQDSWMDIDNTGAVHLWVASHNVVNGTNEQIASSDIQTTNGIVHSMNYDFDFENF